MDVCIPANNFSDAAVGFNPCTIEATDVTDKRRSL